MHNYKFKKLLCRFGKLNVILPPLPTKSSFNEKSLNFYSLKYLSRNDQMPQSLQHKEQIPSNAENNFLESQNDKLLKKNPTSTVLDVVSTLNTKPGANKATKLHGNVNFDKQNSLFTSNLESVPLTDSFDINEIQQQKSFGRQELQEIEFSTERFEPNK